MPILTTLGAACAKAWGFTSGVVKDQYFNLVSLLLPGNGTNATNNRDFRDSSSNNFSITPNGNVTQGSFSPFSQTGWSNYFNGSSYLSTASNAAFAFGTGDFSIEFWFYPTVAATQRNISFPTSNAPIMNMTSSRTLEFGNYGISTIATTSNTLNLNAWNFCAASRVSGTLRLFINGVQGASVSDSTNFVQSLVNIGTDTGGIFATGYMADVRIIKGSGFTTSTVPTAPLTAISGTSLLTCQSNRFVDNSSSPKTITTSGSPTVVAFSPFAPTAAYTTSVVGGSGYFDGNGDYLEAAYNSAFDMGTGNFTAEFYVYTQDQSNSYPGILANSTYNATGAVNIRYDNTGNANKFFVYLFGASPADPAITSGTYGFNQWVHVALVRDSSTSLKLYVNGVLDGSQTISSGQTVSFGSVVSTALRVGRGFDVDGANGYYAGTISNIRIVKGQALASGNFTPPTAPVTSSAVGWTGANAAGSLTGTVSLLLNFTNAGIFDATAKNDLETVGNAQISTTQSKWGGGSIYFDGTSTVGLTIPNSSLLTFGSGDWSIEFWIYRVGNSTTQGVFDQRTAAATEVRPLIYINTSNQISYYTNGADRITASLSQNTWVYVAVVKSSGVTRMYIDGTVQATTYTDANTYLAPTNQTRIGRLIDGFPLNGYIDDFRITLGQARTTTASPTAPFPMQ